MSELRAEDPDAFSPFTIDDWLDSGWHTYEDCEGWPAPSTWISPLPVEIRFAMDRMSWVEDLQVSGKVRWDRYTGEIRATVDFEGSATGSLNLSWNDWDKLAQAEATGEVGNDEIDWSFPAP